MRASNGPFTLEVRDLELRLPVREAPGSRPGVESPAAPLARDGTPLPESARLIERPASVVRALDGKFFMYVSVGSEVWVGSADHPLGPWSDAHGGTPLIPENYRPGFHMIDAEAFVDALLPDALKNANPLQIARLVDGASSRDAL